MEAQPQDSNTSSRSMVQSHTLLRSTESCRATRAWSTALCPSVCRSEPVPWDAAAFLLSLAACRAKYAATLAACTDLLCHRDLSVPERAYCIAA